MGRQLQTFTVNAQNRSTSIMDQDTLCCIKVSMKTSEEEHKQKEVMGLFRLLRNIEDDFITSNSAVAFTIKKTSTFLYQDRHGNWTVGKWVGDPSGLIRGNPKKGANQDCPCKVTAWQYYDKNKWNDDESIIVEKCRTWGHDYV